MEFSTSMLSKLQIWEQFKFQIFRLRIFIRTLEILFKVFPLPTPRKMSHLYPCYDLSYTFTTSWHYVLVFVSLTKLQAPQSRDISKAVSLVPRTQSWNKIITWKKHEGIFTRIPSHLWHFRCHKVQWSNRVVPYILLTLTCKDIRKLVVILTCQFIHVRELKALLSSKFSQNFH